MYIPGVGEADVTLRPAMSNSSAVSGAEDVSCKSCMPVSPRMYFSPARASTTPAPGSLTVWANKRG